MASAVQRLANRTTGVNVRYKNNRLKRDIITRSRRKSMGGKGG